MRLLQKEKGQSAPSGQNWNNLHNKVSKAIIDYNPNYKSIFMCSYRYKELITSMRRTEQTDLS